MELVNLETCSWSVCTKPGQMYICVRVNDFVSFWDFNIWFCCDSVVFLVFHLINIAQLGKVHLSLATAWQPSSIVVSFLHYNLHWDLSLLGTGEGSWPQSSNAPSYANRPEVAHRGAFLIVVVSLQYVFGECNVLCVLNISCWFRNYNLYKRLTFVVPIQLSILFQW